MIDKTDHKKRRYSRPSLLCKFAWKFYVNVQKYRNKLPDFQDEDNCNEFTGNLLDVQEKCDKVCT